MSLSDEIIDRMKKFKGFKTDTELAIYLKIEPNTISSWKSRKLIPPKRVFAFCDKEGLSKDYMFSGEGEMFQKPEKNRFEVAEDVDVFNKAGVPEDDPETIELLTMTREILKSNTGYAYSLAANIRSFHHAMKTERRMSDFESELSIIKEIVKKCPIHPEESCIKKKM